MLWIGATASVSGCPGRPEQEDETRLEPEEALTREDVELLSDLEILVDWELLQGWDPNEPPPSEARSRPGRTVEP